MKRTAQASKYADKCLLIILLIQLHTIYHMNLLFLEFSNIIYYLNQNLNIFINKNVFLSILECRIIHLVIFHRIMKVIPPT